MALWHFREILLWPLLLEVGDACSTVVLLRTYVLYSMYSRVCTVHVQYCTHYSVYSTVLYTLYNTSASIYNEVAMFRSFGVCTNIYCTIKHGVSFTCLLYNRWLIFKYWLAVKLLVVKLFKSHKWQKCIFQNIIWKFKKFTRFFR